MGQALDLLTLKLGRGDMSNVHCESPGMSPLVSLSSGNRNLLSCVNDGIYLRGCFPSPVLTKSFVPLRVLDVK